MQRDPRACGQRETRWTLTSIRQACDWLQGCSLPGVDQILDRLNVVWKRARAVMRRPDPNYEGTRADGADLRARVRERNDRLVVLDLDEVTVERQPTLANAYAPRGGDQPRAQLRQRDTTLTRRVGALNAVPG